MKDLTPVTTRPAPEGRLEKEMAVYDLPEQLDIPYTGHTYTEVDIT